MRIFLTKNKLKKQHEPKKPPANQTSPQQHNNGSRARPHVPGFNPDPSGTVADGVYYLATSSFEYVPGVPVYRSTDLSRWELVGHVVTRAEQLGVRDAGAGGEPELPRSASVTGASTSCSP